MTEVTLAPLLHKLDLVRRRDRRDLAQRAAVSAVTAGLAAALLFETGRRVAPTATDAVAGFFGLDASLGFSLALGVAVGLAFAAAWTLGLPRLAGRDRVARVLDRELGLAERLSTATGLDLPGRRLNAMEGALVDDALTRAAGIDHAGVRPMRLPPGLVATALVALLLAIVQFAPVGSVSSPPAEPVVTAAAPAAAALLTETQRTEAAEALRQAAALLGDGGAEPAADDRQALAREAERVAAALEGPAGADRMTLEAGLGELLDEVAATAAATPEPENADPAVGEAQALIATALDRIAETGGEAPPELAFVNAEDAGGNLEPATPDDTERTTVPPGPERGIGDGAGQQPTDHVEGNLGGQQVMLEDDDEGDEVVNQARAGATPRPGAEPGNVGVETNLEHPELDMGAPGGIGRDQQTGGNTQRGETAGEIAGNAVQAPGAEGPLPPEVAVNPDNGMVIEGEANPEGRRIRLEIPPAPQQTATSAAPALPAGWTVQPETPASRLSLNPAARELASRYFAIVYGDGTP